MKYAIVILINDDVHAVFEIANNSDITLRNLRQKVQEMNPPARNVRIQECEIKEAIYSTDILLAIKECFE